MNERVGIIGLGVLGSAMAPNLVKSGFQVIGYDLRAEALEKSAADGVEPARSPREVAENSEFIVTCLPTIEALHEVCGGPGGLADAEGAGGRIVIETSTMPIAEKERARDAVARAGLEMLDCPVSGNRVLALKKQLTAFASGDQDVFAKAEKVIAGFAHRVFYIGPFGDGSKMKFCGNILNLVHNAAAAEVMVLGMKSGLDPAIIHKVISGSGSSSSMFEVRGALMVAEDYGHEGMNFSTPIKDARTISQHAADLCVPLPIYQAALQPYYAAVAQGYYDQDASAVCRVMEQAANVVRES